MNKKRIGNPRIFVIIAAGVFFLIAALVVSGGKAFAQGGVDPDQYVTSSQEINPYFTVENLIMPDGTKLIAQIIKGPPTPPGGRAEENASVLQVTPMAATSLTEVPSFTWVFGCSAVSGSMVAGFYDRSGYPNMYAGPTNGGVVPLVEDASWGTWTDVIGDSYPNNPLIASHNGLDGRLTRGSIDDYWVSYLGGSSDPYITNGWAQHAWGEAIGDYMKTSQSAYGNDDGSTAFYGYNSSTKLNCSAMGSIAQYDGTYGRKLFYEARGYTVTDCYSQATDNRYSGGFSLTNFKAEIDAGHPVFINLAGHSIVGVGYDPASSIIYIHDTWDNNTHTMTWGGAYSTLTMQSVSIVNLASATPVPSATTGSATNITTTGATLNGTVNANGYSTTVTFQYGLTTSYGSEVTAGQSPVTGTGSTAVSANISGLTPGTLYHFRVVAVNTYGTKNGSDATFTSQALPPADFGKSSPANGATGQATSLTLSWNATSPVTYYQYCYSTASGCSNWTNAGNVTSVTISNLAGTSTYFWQVRAWNGTGGPTAANGGAYWSFTTQVQVTIPSAPGGVSASDGTYTDKVRISWNAATGATSYKVYRNTSNRSSSATQIGTAAASPYDDLTATVGTTYYYFVKACNSAGCSGFSASNSGYRARTPPGAFGKMAPANGATNQATSLTISWSASAGATAYYYCYATTATCNNWKNAGSATSKSLTGLKSATTYYWHVRATNKWGTTYSDGVSTAYWTFRTR